MTKMIQLKPGLAANFPLTTAVNRIMAPSEAQKKNVGLLEF